MNLVNEEEEDGNTDVEILENGNDKSKCLRKYWSVIDDSHLINGWLNISKTGSRYFWDRITAFVNEIHPRKDGPRTTTSCKNRWAKISKSVTKFFNAMAQAREKATPEMSESDVLILANQLYCDDVKTDFHLSHAYELLQNEPKFHDYISKKKPDICEVQPNAEDELSFSEAEGSSKRSRLNEGGDHLSTNSVDDDPCTPRVQIRSLDPRTPQVQTRSLAVEGQDNREVEPMQSAGSMEEQIRSSLQVFRGTNQKVDEWKEVKLREIQANLEIEEKRIAMEVKKIAQKNQDNRYKLLNTLLGKSSLSEFDEALKNKLCAELFPE